MEKLKNYGGGKLFEPQSLYENDKVASVGYEVLGTEWSLYDDTQVHIGVTDNVQEGTWAYESDGSNITLVPRWSYSYPYAHEYDNCITFGANHWSLGDGDWSIIQCTAYSTLYDYMSICELLPNK